MSAALLSAYPFNQQSTAHAGVACLYPLHETALLNIRGKDAAKFMQGQMTAHIQEISPQQWRRGANCTAKGRMVNSFTLLQENTEEPSYLLAMQQDLVVSSLEHLKKYAVFFKTSLSVAPDWVLLGAHGPELAPHLSHFWPHIPEDACAVVQNDIGCLLRMDIADTFQLWLRAEHAKAVLDYLTPNLQLQSAEQGLAHYLVAGIGRVLPQTRELFIPQMLNLHKLAGISFNKGCYTGQEIIARMQYLGKLKRHMQVVAFSASSSPEPGSLLYSADKSGEVGELVEAVSVTPGRYLALAVLEDSFKDSALKLGPEPAPAVELLSLPYSLD